MRTPRQRRPAAVAVSGDAASDAAVVRFGRVLAAASVYPAAAPRAERDGQGITLSLQAGQSVTLNRPRGKRSRFGSEPGEKSREDARSVQWPWGLRRQPPLEDSCRLCARCSERR